MVADEFVKWLYPVTSKNSEINPIFIVAQAALESGWGNSKIGKFNLFGITKGSSWTGPTILVDTVEYFSNPNINFKLPEKVEIITRITDKNYKYNVKRLFRDYKTLEEALNDHFKILSGQNFKDAWPYRKDPETFVKHLVDNIGPKYATDPQYLTKMYSLFAKVRKIVTKFKL